MHRRPWGLCTLAAAAVLAGCDSSSPSTTPQMYFDLATNAVAGTVLAKGGPSYAVAAMPETFTDGAGNTLVLNQVQLVLSQIELKQAIVTVPCDAATGADDCAEIQLPLRLLDLPLGTAGAQRAFGVAIPPGTYGKIEFEIHKPESSTDAAFIASNPDFDGRSIRVTGTYNGTPFVFTSDLDVEMELELAPPLVAAESGSTDLTLFVDLNTWFRSGANLVDPATANQGQANEGLVKENIKNSLEAFEDNDRDGVED